MKKINSIITAIMLLCLETYDYHLNLSSLTRNESELTRKSMLYAFLMKHVYKSHSSYQQAPLEIVFYKRAEGNHLRQEINSGMIKGPVLTLFGEVMSILRSHSGMYFIFLRITYYVIGARILNKIYLSNPVPKFPCASLV